MRKMMAALALALATVVGAGAAHAQDARKAELGREIVQLLEVEETIGQLFTTMSPMLATGMARELRLSSSEEARLGELLNEELRNAMPEVMTSAANMYSERLSEQELTEIVTFLRSPSGRAMMESQKNAEEEMARVGQMLGMRVALQALTRLNAERGRR